MTTSQRYREFGQREARGASPVYERLALAVAQDGDLLALLGALPEPKRQPNLLFAVTRFLGGPVEDPQVFREWVLGNRELLLATMLRRSTQTNEPGRCAPLLPVLAALPQPLALLEVGASAGLCLYPDAYRYRYRPRGGAGTEPDHLLGPPESPVQLDCVVDGRDPRRASAGPVLPERVPRVVWRAGLDLNPLDVTDQDDLRWLEALVWPDQHHRRARLLAAAGIARAAPPILVRGDLTVDLPALAARAPGGATLVVVHTSVLTYVPAADRGAFVSVVRSLPGHWISNEDVGVLPEVERGVPAPPGTARSLLALDGRPLAFTALHGQAMHWVAA